MYSFSVSPVSSLLLSWFTNCILFYIHLFLRVFLLLCFFCFFSRPDINLLDVRHQITYLRYSFPLFIYFFLFIFLDSAINGAKGTPKISDLCMHLRSLPVRKKAKTEITESEKETVF